MNPATSERRFDIGFGTVSAVDHGSDDGDGRKQSDNEE